MERHCNERIVFRDLARHDILRRDDPWFRDDGCQVLDVFFPAARRQYDEAYNYMQAAIFFHIEVIECFHCFQLLVQPDPPVEIPALFAGNFKPGDDLCRYIRRLGHRRLSAV